MRDRLRILACIGVGVTLLLAGCGDSDDSAATGTDEESLGFVGTVEGTDAFVSVMVADSDTETDEAIVYICDGEAELREWFRGPVDDPTTFQLTNDTDASVTVEFIDGTFRGEFTDATGQAHTFDTVEATSEAGLYEVDDSEATADDVWAAWIVDNDGNERGAFLRSGAFQATPRLSFTTFRLSRFSTTSGAIEMNGIVAPNN
jgi:hypothetical protein